MVTDNNVEKFCSVLDKMQETYISKNHDYGNVFHDSMEEFGLISPVIRLNDKIARLKHFAKNIKSGIMVHDESIRDTLLDLANYAVMTYIEMSDFDENGNLNNDIVNNNE